ncbi:MAG: hypothetical protein ABI068_13885 [Ktedonobacterales bacterium]
MEIGAFGVSEYTLVFRRALRRRPDGATGAWAIVRPLNASVSTPVSDDVAQVFIVPICSTLALDSGSYERFLVASDALPRALRLLARLTFAQPQTAENARKQIQSFIMAAEVEYIVQGMTA